METRRDRRRQRVPGFKVRREPKRDLRVWMNDGSERDYDPRKTEQVYEQTQRKSRSRCSVFVSTIADAEACKDLSRCRKAFLSSNAKTQGRRENPSAVLLLI